jgi:SAM-dependent methyltransferase
LLDSPANRQESSGSIRLSPTTCAICGSGSEAEELYPANLDPTAFSANVFSARRAPDRLHYRMVRCRECGLVRSDPIADNALLKGLYADSLLNYKTESANLRQTYGRSLARLERYGVVKGTLLEIGCGHGFLLEEALSQGYSEVRGVEPSRDAVAKSAANIRSQIVCDIFRPGLFSAESFDAICMFQVFDHMSEPAALLDECLHVLRPGGLMLVLNHNVTAFSARLLGRRSPIIDVEHTFLYSPRTIRRLAEQHGFEAIEVRSVWNRYALQYLSQLVPLPSTIKTWGQRLLSATGLGRIPLTVPLGNLCLIARKPARPE